MSAESAVIKYGFQDAHGCCLWTFLLFVLLCIRQNAEFIFLYEFRKKNKAEIGGVVHMRILHTKEQAISKSGLTFEFASCYQNHFHHQTNKSNGDF